MSADAQKEMIARMSGSFAYVMEMRMSPTSEWVSSEGTANYGSILAGKYLRGVLKGDDGEGGAYEAQETIGYDSVREQFRVITIDNYGTQPFMHVGHWNAGSRSLETHGKMDDCTTGKRDNPFRHVVTFAEDGSGWKQSMFMPHSDGVEFEIVRTTMQRN